jgi:hypothetical protein
MIANRLTASSHNTLQNSGLLIKSTDGRMHGVGMIGHGCNGTYPLASQLTIVGSLHSQ